jgi:hypothetical protein
MRPGTDESGRARPLVLGLAMALAAVLGLGAFFADMAATEGSEWGVVGASTPAEIFAPTSVDQAAAPAELDDSVETSSVQVESDPDTGQVRVIFGPPPPSR